MESQHFIRQPISFRARADRFSLPVARAFLDEDMQEKYPTAKHMALKINLAFFFLCATGSLT